MKKKKERTEDIIIDLTKIKMKWIKQDTVNKYMPKN